MRICTISDMHGKLPQIEQSDILVIAGDVCPHFDYNVGSSLDRQGQFNWLLTTFSDWLSSQPVKHVVMTFGNHDWFAEEKTLLDMISLPKTHILMNAHKTVAGFKFFGSPYSPWFHDWAFNSPKGDDSEPFLKKIWDAIDPDTDIVITHGPPFGYGDVAPEGIPTGSESLTRRIKEEVKPLLAVSGHIHGGYQARPYDRGNDKMGYIVNASVLDERYQLVHDPLYFDIEDLEIVPASL